MKKILLVALLLLIIWSCNNKKNNQNTSLPASRGQIGEIILVMDSTLWNDSLGNEIKKTFRATLPGLPREEPLFKLHYVNPSQVNSVLQKAKNMLFVMTLQNNSNSNKIVRAMFTKESLERIKQDTSIYRYNMKDVYAKDQEIMYLFGHNEDDLIKKIRENRTALQEYFNNVEKNRIIKSLYKSQEKKNIENAISQKHNFGIKIPYGWDVAKNTSDFVWLRRLDPIVDKSVFIYYKDYNSEGAFSKDSILSLRDEISLKYLRDIESPEIHMQTQSMYPTYVKEISFNNKYAVEVRGLWKLSDISLGGPFLAYVLVDEKLNRLYYIEGFVAAPSKDNKGEYIRELEAILSTFTTSGELPSS